MRRISKTAVALAALLLAAACGTDGGGQASTGDGETSLEGETIDLVVPYDPGGGYDTYARLLAPHLEECLGATIVVKNEPGAGGLLATSKTFVAPPDSLRVTLTNTVGVVSAQLAEAEGASFEAQKFSWLGRVAAEPNVLVVAADSKFETFEDMRSSTDTVRFVATGPGSNEYVNSTVLPQVYDFPSEIVTGFEGSESARAAVISGDADAHILPLDSQLKAIEAGDVKPLLVISDQPHKALPDVPTTAEFPPEQGQGDTLDSLINLAETGRSLAGPPGMDSGRLDVLRDGVRCAVRKDDLLAEAEEQQREIDPLSGEKTAKIVAAALDASPQFMELITESF